MLRTLLPGTPALFLTLTLSSLWLPQKVYGGAGLSLEETPSWRVILFLLGFLVLSIVVEHSLHKLGHYLIHHGKTGPMAALTKIKDELMLMGFISLVLIIAEDSILNICSDVSTSGVPVLGEKCVAILHKDLAIATSSAATSSAAGSAARRLASQSTLAMLDYCCGLESTTSNSSTSSRMLLSRSSTSTSTGTGTSTSMPWSIGHGLRRNLGGAADDCQCPCGQTPFIEQASLHQIHVLIFAYAATHILYGCVVMALAQYKVLSWKKWETWAENPELYIENFSRPEKKSTNGCIRSCFPFFEQLYKGAFGSFGYASMRKLFIVRHDLDNSFDFYKHVSEGLSHDFAEVLGIQWWMWIVAILQILAEGYAIPAVGAYISLFVSLTVGYKLQIISDELRIALFDHYDTDGDGSVDNAELAVMLQVTKEKDDLKSIEARFWCNKPHIMLTLMQFCMWQNGQTLAGLVFYGSYFAGMDGSCYYVNRGIPALVLSCLVCILTLLHAAFVTVPTFSMVTHMASHKQKKDAVLKAHKFKKKHGLHRAHTIDTVDQHLMLVHPTSNDSKSRDLESSGTLQERIAKLEKELNQLKGEQQQSDFSLIPAPPSSPPPKSESTRSLYS